MKRRNESAGGRASPGEGGFTLLEILVTLALITLLASVLIVGATRLLTDQPATPEELFRKVVGEARKAAVEGNAEVRLSFDPKAKAFKTDAGAGPHSFPVNLPGDVAFDFLSGQKGGSAILVGGVLVETQPLASVTFYPDGTCSPFRVQIHLAGNARTMAIDPWTCAPMLESEKQP